MAMNTEFRNVLSEKKQDDEPAITELTVLQESDPNTIYNLIFAQKPQKEDTKKD